MSVAGRGLLILGRSGSGKSALALELMALGACLVSDDLTEVRQGDAGLELAPPPGFPGWIEARGVGLLRAACCGPVPLALVADLDTPETDRLPPRRSTRLLGQSVPLLHKIEAAYFPAALLQYLRSGRAE